MESEETQPENPLLLAARRKLDGKFLSEALAIYEEVLAADGENAGVLATISGDLGSTGHVVPIIELIAPRYDAERHGPAAGLNLLQAYLAVGDPEAAQHVLDVLFALNLPELEERLHGFSNAIAGLLAQGVTPGAPILVSGPDGAPLETAVKVSLISISKPIWFYGLEPLAERILPPKGDRLRNVAFAQLALPGGYANFDEAMAKPADEAGRLAQALPLWLAEMFYFSPHYAPIAAVAVVNEPDGSRHPMIFGAEWTAENIRQLVETTAGGLDYVFTGALTGRDGAHELVLRVWEIKKYRERRQFTARWMPETADAELEKLRLAVCQYMEWSEYPGGTGLGYRAPSSPRAWLDALGASLGLFLVGKGILPKEMIAPPAPAFDALAPLAAREPSAALAWLTSRARLREVGMGPEPAETRLVDDPIVAEAREALAPR